MTEMGRRAPQGDMLKSVYDTDEDSTVDNSAKLQGSNKAQVQDHSPATHGHPQEDIEELETDLAGKSDTGHGHAEADVTDLVTDLAGKAALVHGHAEADVTDLVTDLAGKAALVHGHAEADVTDLVTDLAGKAALVHGHTEAQISDLDHDALKVKGVIINDAAKADQKVLAYDSGTDRIVYITPAPAGAALASIQRAVIVLPNGVKNASATISSVDTSKSFILRLGSSGNTADSTDNTVRLYLANATTVSATRHDKDTSIDVSFVVVEFSSGVASVQNGTGTLPNLSASINVTVTSVDTAKAFLIHLGEITDHVSYQNSRVYLSLTSATNIYFKRRVTAGSVTVGYCLFEFS